MHQPQFAASIKLVSFEVWTTFPKVNPRLLWSFSSSAIVPHLPGKYTNKKAAAADLCNNTSACGPVECWHRQRQAGTMFQVYKPPLLPAPFTPVKKRQVKTAAAFDVGPGSGVYAETCLHCGAQLPQKRAETKGWGIWPPLRTPGLPGYKDTRVLDGRCSLTLHLICMWLMSAASFGCRWAITDLWPTQNPCLISLKWFGGKATKAKLKFARFMQGWIINSRSMDSSLRDCNRSWWWVVWEMSLRLGDC